MKFVIRVKRVKTEYQRVEVEATSIKDARRLAKSKAKEDDKWYWDGTIGYQTEIVRTQV